MKRQSHLQRTEEALHEREITFAALAKVAPVGIMRFDAQGRCNYVNDRWTDITGLTIDEAIGEGWGASIHPDDRGAAVDHWRHMLEAEGLFREEFRICRRDGSIRWVLAEGASLRSYAGERIGFIRAVTDITIHRQLEAELSAARQDLEERVRQRTAALEMEMAERARLEKEVLETRDNEQQRFSQDLHDGLGQSLTGVLFRALAAQRDLEAEKSPHAANAAKIADLVNDAINQAHALARGIQPVPPRPDGLVCALEELVQKLCDAQLADCVFQCAGPVRINDHGAATHLYRIAQEALTNAIKHSGAAKITLQLKATESGGCALSVADDGRGFSNDGVSERGRGLHIMRHRARLIDARLNVRSAPRRGAVVECIFRQRDGSQIG